MDRMLAKCYSFTRIFRLQPHTHLETITQPGTTFIHMTKPMQNSSKETKNKQQKTMYIVQGAAPDLHWKYYFNSWTLIGRESIFSSSDWRWYVCRQSFLCTVYGPMHRDYNLMSLPLSAWDLSDFNSKSLALKLFFPINFLSNHLLIWLVK